MSDLQSKTEALKAQWDSLQRQKDQFEPDLDALFQAVAAAKESYQEMVAYYAELERIQKGMEAEGFVDMASFAQALLEKNQQVRSRRADALAGGGADGGLRPHLEQCTRRCGSPPTKGR